MAVQKLSQIAPAGGAPAVTDQAVFVTGGSTDNLVTVNQLGLALPLFTSTTRGQVPLSGGGTTNFLRADGTFAAPPAGTPAGLNTQIQFNNAGAFGAVANLTSDGTNITQARLGSTISLDWDNGAGGVDTSLFRDGAAGRIGQRSGSTAQSLYVYNTFSSSTNFERGCMDWTTTANRLIMGFQKGSGGGTDRNVQIRTGAGANLLITNANDFCSANFNTGGRLVLSGNNMVLGYNNGSDAFTTLSDCSLARAAASVMTFGDGVNNANGWMQWQGEQRVTSDQTFTSNVALTTIMTVNVQAGRTYSFDVYLSITGSAGGVQAAISGTATTTDVRYDGYVIDNAAAGTKGAAQAAALGTAVANPATITGPASAVIRGTVTVNAAGTLTVQAAQATSSGTSTVIKRGSYAWFHDMP